MGKDVWGEWRRGARAGEEGVEMCADLVLRSLNHCILTAYRDYVVKRRMCEVCSD